MASAVTNSSETKTLRFGSLGCARIVRRNLVAGFELARHGELTALASRNGQTAAAWAAEFGIPKSYASYEALLDDPDIDAVYLPLPNELHLPWVRAAAEAGKHVLCEKPLGLDLADAEEIVATCRESNVLLMEAFMWRHHPRVAKARQLIADGTLGELRLVKMDFSFTIDLADWRLDPARGGGALYDLGCYGINAARLFTGAEPIETHARSHLHSTGVDLTTAMQLVFPGDVLALLDCSFEAPVRNRLELVGTRGTLELPGGVLPAPQSELLLTSSDGTERIAFDTADQYACEIDAFATGVSSGSLPGPAEDGLANMRVLDAVRLAAGIAGR